MKQRDKRLRAASYTLSAIILISGIIAFLSAPPPVRESDVTLPVTTEASLTDVQPVVCIDAGHGGRDVGAIGENGRYESADTLALALALREELEARGASVVLTRDSDRDMTLEERAAVSNDANALYLLSLHRNYWDESDVCGAELWIAKNPNENEAVLGECIMNALIGAGISQSRGIKHGRAYGEGDNYEIIQYSSAAACIIELGFISSPVDNELFDTRLREYAAAIAEAVITQIL